MTTATAPTKLTLVTATYPEDTPHQDKLTIDICALGDPIETQEDYDEDAQALAAFDARFPELVGRDLDAPFTEDEWVLIRSRLEWWEWTQLVSALKGDLRYRIRKDERLRKRCAKPTIPLYFYRSGYTFHRPVDCGLLECVTCAFKHHIHPVRVFLESNFDVTLDLGSGYVLPKDKRTVQNRLSAVKTPRVVLSLSDGGAYVVSQTLVIGLEKKCVAKICDELIELSDNPARKVTRISPTVWEIPKRWSPSIRLCKDCRRKPKCKECRGDPKHTACRKKLKADRCDECKALRRKPEEQRCEGCKRCAACKEIVSPVLFARGHAGDRYDFAMSVLGLADDEYYDGTEAEAEIVAKKLAAETGYEVIKVRLAR